MFCRSGGKKVLGLGLGFGGEKMEATELEEGEACLNKNAADSSFDPDVALSYIVSYLIFLIDLNLVLIFLVCLCFDEFCGIFVVIRVDLIVVM